MKNAAAGDILYQIKQGVYMKKTILILALAAAMITVLGWSTGCKKTLDAVPTYTATPTNTPLPGYAWTKIASTSFTGRSDFDTVEYGSNLWVYGGMTGTAGVGSIYSSTNGSAWSLRKATADFGARYGLTALVFTSVTSKVFVIAGSTGSYNKDVWSSTNGVDFTCLTKNAEFGSRMGHTSVVFNAPSTTTPAMWVIGGHTPIYQKDAWYSTDGILWTAATTNTEFGTRTRHASVVFNNKIWVTGGLSAGYMSDVWSSADGVTWVQETAAADFGIRANHDAFVYNNKIWVTGGSDGVSAKTDLWSSADGVTWTLVSASAFTPARWFLRAAMFNSKPYIMGGANQATDTFYQDVWRGY